MTPEELAEAEQLVGSGMLHARMLPLLRAALAALDDQRRLRVEFVELSPAVWTWRVWGHNGRWRYVAAEGRPSASRAEAVADFRSLKETPCDE